METWDNERARRYLMAMEHPPEQARDHENWVNSGVPRFLRTLEMVPPGAPGQRCLEVGGMPYTFTLLMKKLRTYEMLTVDYFLTKGEQPKTRREVVRLPEYNEEHVFESVFCDLERERTPFADASVDGALCCEVLEHVTTDPTAMLVEIHRVLRPDAWFVLTTPNVACVQHIRDLIHGRNVYKPYELAFGPTWRHNREYTPKEVVDLLTETGFIVEQLLVEETLPPGVRPPLSDRLLSSALKAVYGHNYGSQIYVRARRGPVARRVYPKWLFTHEQLPSKQQ